MSYEILHSSTCHILLLEDDDVDYRAVERALKRNTIHCTMDRVSSIEDIYIQLKKDKKYDIILTDMNLPDSNGLDTITTLLRVVGKTPIVVLSGTDDESIALQAVHAGAQDFIPKQYIDDASLINRTLRHAIERHQLKIGLESTRDKARYLAHYDQCTSLPNRLLFLDRINQAVMQGQRNQNKFALFFIDLDHFKHINDSIGHSAGDEVLRCVSERMKKVIRESDTIARFGGDEFVMILQLSDNEEAMLKLAQKIIDQINLPIPYGHHTCTVGASIGVAYYPRHGYSPEHLVKNADIAMYEAKKLGRNQVKMFNHELFEKQNLFFCLEKALRDALRYPDDNFSLHYQPRVMLSNGDIPSVEALIRWQSPKLGNIPPDKFIPIAEELGLIEQIDEWVFNTACKKAIEWRSLGMNIRIGINISGRSFNRKNFVNMTVRQILTKHNVSGSALELEITESVLLSNRKQILEHMIALKALGLRLAIDDFGTGFSSLSYLNDFPIDTLKIDGSFICDANSNKNEQALLRAIIALGSALNMKVVAECVETQEQEQYLSDLGCDEGQGYYWCKPTKNWQPQMNIEKTTNKTHNTST